MIFSMMASTNCCLCMATDVNPRRKSGSTAAIMHDYELMIMPRLLNCISIVLIVAVLPLSANETSEFSLPETFVESAGAGKNTLDAPAAPVTVQINEHAPEDTATPTEVPGNDTDPQAVNVAGNESGPTILSASDSIAQAVQPFRLLGKDIIPGTLRRLSWYASKNSAGLAEATPVLVAHGNKSGPTLCVIAAVHGDELNGIEIVRNLLYDLQPERLQGTVIGVPIVNLYGFRQGSRYLSDRRDLNRYFPGNPNGSFAARIAHSFFNSIVRHCNYLVDLHTGSFQRTNLPQLRADLNKESILNLSKGFGATVVLHGAGPQGSLRESATRIGIPAVVIEAGEPLRVQPDEVAHGVKALRSLLNYLDMMPRFSLWGEPQPVFYESYWVRAESDGILTSNIKLGQNVDTDDLLGQVTDPITNLRTEIRSPYSGRVIGMALNQSMRPGYAAYHIGIRKSEEELAQEIETGTLDDAVNNDESSHVQEQPGSEKPARTDTGMDTIDPDQDEHSIMDPPIHDALFEAVPLDNQAGE